MRPALRLFAGRDDYSRTQFARQFREVLADEFDRMRAEPVSGRGKRGWLDRDLKSLFPLDAVVGSVALLVLAIALPNKRSVFGGFERRRDRKCGQAEARLAEDFEQTKSRVEAALARIDVTIHPELHDHAYRDGPMGRIGATWTAMPGRSLRSSAPISTGARARPGGRSRAGRPFGTKTGIAPVFRRCARYTPP